MQSDLRVAIFKALRAAGIEIPFNQVDVNMRDLEAIKSHLAEVLQKRPNGADREPRARAPASNPARQPARRQGGLTPRYERAPARADRLVRPFAGHLCAMESARPAAGRQHQKVSRPAYVIRASAPR